MASRGWKGLSTYIPELKIWIEPYKNLRKNMLNIKYETQPGFFRGGPRGPQTALDLNQPSLSLVAYKLGKHDEIQCSGPTVPRRKL